MCDKHSFQKPRTERELREDAKKLHERKEREYMEFIRDHIR